MLYNVHCKGCYIEPNFYESQQCKIHAKLSAGIQRCILYVYVPLLVTAVRVLEQGGRAGWLNGHWACHHTEWTAWLISSHVFYMFMFPLLVTTAKVLEWGGRAGWLNGHWACHHTEWTAWLISSHVFYVFMFPLLVTAVKVLELGGRAGWLNGHWTCHHTEWTAWLISSHVFYVFRLPLLVTADNYDTCCTWLLTILLWHN